MPTAVFYNAEDGSRAFGRAAIASYVDGHEGRLMRSIKSILGSDLMDEATELPNGLQVRFIDVVVAYLRELKQQAEAHWKAPIGRVVIGRPVFFVDDDPERDARAQETLLRAARAAGIPEVQFQYEPIAAALDYESRLIPSDGERLVLVADIGGGTSDFSVVRASAAAHGDADRRADVLANHGVHLAGTDFDRAINLATIMPVLGYGGDGPGGMPVPSKIYFDLATWHLINTTYTPSRVAELRLMRRMYDDQRAHQRLMRVLEQHRGHELAARAEAAKIEVSDAGHAVIDLRFIEPGPAEAAQRGPAGHGTASERGAHRRHRARNRAAGANGQRQDRRALLHRRLDRAQVACGATCGSIPIVTGDPRRPLCERRQRAGDHRRAQVFLLKRAPAGRSARRLRKRFGAS